MARNVPSPAALRRVQKSDQAERAPAQQTVPRGKDPSWRSEGWAPNYDSASLVDYVSDVMLAELRDAITGGRKPSGGPQRELKPGTGAARQAARGHRPRARGWTARGTLPFPMKIRRGRLSAGNRQASVKIRPNKRHRGFVTVELRRGVEYFTAEGEMQRLAEEATRAWCEAATRGAAAKARPSEHDADELAGGARPTRR